MYIYTHYTVHYIALYLYTVDIYTHTHALHTHIYIYTVVKGIAPLPTGNPRINNPWLQEMEEVPPPKWLERSLSSHQMESAATRCFPPKEWPKATVWCPTPKNHGPPSTGTCAIWATGTCWLCKGSHAVTSRQHRSGQVTHTSQLYIHVYTIYTLCIYTRCIPWKYTLCKYIKIYTIYPYGHYIYIYTRYMYTLHTHIYMHYIHTQYLSIYIFIELHIYTFTCIYTPCIYICNHNIAVVIWHLSMYMYIYISHYYI